ncbi:cation-transporting ATPase [Aureococcus anophagefferens]|nr:cation-transporting ATPase [Aureococcus anophagefferens]
MPSADDDAAHVLRIGGMTCGHCVGAVTSALEGVAGVARADVDLERGLATVAAAPGASLALADLVDAVEASGFDASDAAGGGGAATTQTLAVEGMSCGQCEAWVREALRGVGGVEAVDVSVQDGTAAVAGAADPAALAGARALKRLDGVRDVTVFLVLDAVEVLYDARIVGPRLLAHRLSQLGYDASVQADDDGVDVAGEERARKLARVAEVRAFRRRAVAFALRRSLRPRLRFYVGAFNSLRYGTANMDVLVALGTSAAYFYSIYVLYEFMEAKAKGRTSEALRRC